MWSQRRKTDVELDMLSVLPWKCLKAPCLGSATDCSDAKGLWSASIGCSSTFKKRKHSYKAALAVEIRLRVIATNLVVLNCNLHELVRTLHARGGMKRTVGGI